MYRRNVGLLAALSTAFVASAAVAQATSIFIDPGPDYSGRSDLYRRGKGKQARPRKRRNLVTLGHRIRRKHRRAA